MIIYFSGAGGVGIGPLAEIALASGHEVYGSDTHVSPLTEQIEKQGATLFYEQNGDDIEQVHKETPIDWFVYTAALPATHPELVFAQSHNIKATKRDEFLSFIIEQNNLSLLAISGTHGKTTTTSLLVWAMKQLHHIVSYSVGAPLSFGASGAYDSASKYFIYECDEYDRNMLHFHPEVSIITSLDYDHPDTYENVHVYKNAFTDFINQSAFSIMWAKDVDYLEKKPSSDKYLALSDDTDLSHIKLSGLHTRRNAYLVEQLLLRLFPDTEHDKVIEAINSFPGAGRRFERLADGLYSDYGHHPAEIAATLQLARELSDEVVLVYQPHQNIRQHEIRHDYTDCMVLADKIYWLPTYLSRENPELALLSPKQLTENLSNREDVVYAELNDKLWRNIQNELADGKFVICMGAGSIDEWVRSKL